MAEKMAILWFSQSLQLSAWIVPELGNVNFLSYQSFKRSTLCNLNTERVFEQTMN